MDVNTQIDPEPDQPPEPSRFSFKGFLKGSLIRIGFVLVGYLCTAATGTVIILFLGSISNHNDWDRIDKLSSVAALMVVIGAYRFGAWKAGFPKPGRIVRTLLNITWAVLTFVVVGGTVEIAIGHPNIGSGIAGIVAAVLVYMIVNRRPN